jgi:hypothetical protein
VAEKPGIRCRCGRRAETDWQALSVKTSIAWRGDAALDLNMMFDPSPEGVRELKKDIPSIELDHRGIPKYRNDQHHKRCMREMADSMNRIRDEDAAAEERTKAGKMPAPREGTAA